MVGGLSGREPDGKGVYAGCDVCGRLGQKTRVASRVGLKAKGKDEMQKERD